MFPTHSDPALLVKEEAQGPCFSRPDSHRPDLLSQQDLDLNPRTDTTGTSLCFDCKHGGSQEKEGRATHLSPFEAGLLFTVNQFCKGFSVGGNSVPTTYSLLQDHWVPSTCPVSPSVLSPGVTCPLHSWHSAENTQHSSCSWGYNPAAACWLGTYDCLGVTQGAPEPGQLVRESARLPHPAAVPFAGKAWPLGSCRNSTFTLTPTLKI